MKQMMVTLRLGLLDLYNHRRLVAFMVFSIGITAMMLFILEVYKTGMEDKYTELTPQLLVVQSAQSLGEFYGSRLPAKVGIELIKMGIKDVIPEIRTLAGTSAKNAVMLRGVDPEKFTFLETFSVLSGQSLRYGDPPRSTMIGWRLAKSRNLKTGDTILLRGREFLIIGIFKNGTYMDNQAWISLEDAQTLLGWGEDVSIYFIPQTGLLNPGDELPNGIVITQKGENLDYINSQFEPLFGLLGVVVVSLGISSALGLTTVLWRIAWIHRRDMAILRATGFSVTSMVSYLLIQAAAITLIGVLVGCILTLGIALTFMFAVPSFTIVPRIEPASLLESSELVLLLLVFGSLLPAWWLSRINLVEQLHSG